MNAANYLAALKLGAKVPLSNIEGAGLLTFGKIFYVHSGTGSDSNNGRRPSTPFATIDTAIGATTADKGDTILVLPGHAETVTSAITCDVAGVTILGLGQGNQRPAVTGNGTIDAITVTAAGVRIENLRFPAPALDDQTADVNVAAAGCVLRNLYSIGSQTSKNKTDIITVASGGDDLLVENCQAYNTVVDCVSWLSLEAAVARPVIRNNVIMGTFSTGNIMDEATATLALIEGNLLKNTKTSGACLTFTTGNTTGMCSFNHLSGRNTTILSNTVTGTGMDFFENRVTEEASLNGAVIPAADAE